VGTKYEIISLIFDGGEGPYSPYPLGIATLFIFSPREIFDQKAILARGD
jgi:hypothetical protein